MMLGTYFLINKKTGRNKRVTAESVSDAKWLAANSKKKSNQWLDFGEMQKRGIGFIGATEKGKPVFIQFHQKGRTEKEIFVNTMMTVLEGN